MRNHDRTGLPLACLLSAVLLSAGCASPTGGSTTKENEDPLKYTKKLVAEGHATLYNNGAFEVPYTEIKLIPPGPDALTLVSELAGMRAHQSFEESIRKAADSVTIVADGTKRTYELNKDIGAIGREAARAIDSSITENGKVIVYKSTDLGKSIVGRSWDTSVDLMRSNAGLSVIQGSRRGGENIIEGGTSSGDKIIEGGVSAGDRISEGSFASGKGIIAGGVASGNKIIEGSAATGDRLMEGTAGDRIITGGIAAGDRLVESDAGGRIIKEGITTGDRLMEGAAGDRIITGGVAAGDQLVKDSRAAKRKIIAGSSETGAEIASGGGVMGDKIVSGSLDAAKDMSASSIDRSGKAFRYAGTSFIKGYAVVPANARTRLAATGVNIKALNIVAIAGTENEWRSEWSQKTINLLGGTLGDYGTSATSSFRKAGQEMTENYKTQGVSLSVLKSLGWILQGILWDATVEPLAKTTGAALGYISVNLVAYPTVVLVKEGVATTQLAVQVTVDTAKTGYDIVAPSAIAAVAGVYGVADLAVFQPAAGVTAVAGPVAGYTEKGMSVAAGEAVKGGGYVAGQTVKGAGFVAGEAVKGGSIVTGEAVKGGSIVAGGVVMGGSVVAGGAVKGGSVVAGEAVKGGSIVTGEVVKGGSIVTGGLVKGGGYVAGQTVKGGGYVAGVTVMSGGYVAGQVVKGGGYVAGETVKGGGIAAGDSVKGSGYVAGKAVQYIAVPLASAGITVGGGAIGTAVGVTGAMAGGTVFVAGEAGSATTKAFGNVIAGTTLAAGTAVSTAGGATYGVYQLSKAVVVPTGYELGSGIVLSYETLSQVSAHAILAVSDCAYMVLSLEGPRWVLYAVKGNLGKGEDLPTGAILDLKKMQEQGEEIVNLPVSDEEMKKVVESVYGSLPETRAVTDEQK
jgi:hypothetical protein